MGQSARERGRDTETAPTPNKVSRRARNGSYPTAEKREYPAEIGNYEEKREKEGKGQQFQVRVLFLRPKPAEAGGSTGGGGNETFITRPNEFEGGRQNPGCAIKVGG